MDSPFQKAPIPQEERPILDKLLSIRTEIELLKQDKSTYVKSGDVLTIYEKVIEQVHALNKIRVDNRTEQNRVDSVLDDCFQLVALGFMTVGKKNEAPAVYAFVSTVKRLLDHLQEASFFSAKDLESIDDTLRYGVEIIDRARDTHDPDVLILVEARIQVCQTLLQECKTMLSHLTPEKAPIYERLVSILRTMSACNTRANFPKSEVKEFQVQLREIEASLGEKKSNLDNLNALVDEYAEKLKSVSIAEPDAVKAPAEHDLLVDLLQRNLIWSELIQQREGKIDPRFEELYKRLLNIKSSLDKLQLTCTWSIRETDLWDYQRQLARIDEQRVDGNWRDHEGKPADLHAQRTLLYLLRKSYALIYQLLISSEPVSEALQPIYNQLSTLKRCLLEVKKAGGVSSPRELYPYSMKLNSIDKMRVNGRFMVGDEIPEGQASVTQLMKECFDIAAELRKQAQEADEKEGGAESIGVKADQTGVTA